MLVYCATHVESGRRYVGMTSKTLARRRQQHLKQAKGRARGCAYFWAAIRKYGADARVYHVMVRESEITGLLHGATQDSAWFGSGADDASELLQ